MDVTKFFEERRADYLKAFETMKIKLCEDNYYILTEPVDKKSSKNHPELFPFFRYDFLVKKQESKNYINIKVDTDQTLFKSAQSMMYNHLEISMQSFVWNRCKISFDSNIKTDLLNSWYIEAIQPENKNYDTVKNVIHNVNLIDDKSILIDFGTIESQSIVELFEMLQNAGVRNVFISSSNE